MYAVACCIQGWLKAEEIKTFYIKPGSPWENGHFKSFYDKLRAMNASTENSAAICRRRALSWKAGRIEHHERRSHSALGYQIPFKYACTEDEPV